MRVIFRSLFALCCLVLSAAAFVVDLVVRIADTVVRPVPVLAGFIAALASRMRPARRIWLRATALNDRDLGGVHCRGDLGQPPGPMLMC